MRANVPFANLASMFSYQRRLRAMAHSVALRSMPLERPLQALSLIAFAHMYVFD